MLWRDVALAYEAAGRPGAAGAHRQGAPGDVSRHPGATAAPAAARDALAQSFARRRLYRYRLAGDDRRRYSLRLRRRRQRWVRASADGSRRTDAADNFQPQPTRRTWQNVSPISDERRAAQDRSRQGASRHRTKPDAPARSTGRSAAPPKSLLARAAAPTGIGSSSSKPTRRSRPNTSCCSIISAASSPSFRRASPRFCAPARARMAAGRCSTAARSISAARSRPISR